MTQPTKASTIKRAWHLVDIKSKVLGRASVNIASLLMGKGKPYFVRHLDCGDFVVVLNAKDVVLTGKKETQKKYFRFSGYPGGLKADTPQTLRKKQPEEIIRHAVKGMLPQNKLRDRMLKRLLVFAGQDHPYQDKFRS